MRERLRDAREAMHGLFPLSEGLWLDWINDELEAAASDGDGGDLSYVKALYGAAVEDYLSVDLWVAYLE